MIRRAYFTLIEILIVMTLISMISSVGWYLGSAVKEEGARNEVKRIWGRLQLAKEVALSYQVPVTVSFSKDDKSGKLRCNFDYPEKYKLSFRQDLAFDDKKNKHIKKLLFSSFILKKIDAITFQSTHEGEIEKQLTSSFLIELDKGGDNVGGDKDELIKALSFYPPCDLPKGFLTFYSKKKKKYGIVLSGDFSTTPKIKWK